MSPLYEKKERKSDKDTPSKGAKLKIEFTLFDFSYTTLSY